MARLLSFLKISFIVVSIISCSSNDGSVMDDSDDEMMTPSDSLNYVVLEQRITFDVCNDLFCGINQLEFVSNEVGFAISGVHVYKTKNAGIDWEALINQDITGKLVALTENLLFLNTYDGILNSIDGGATWTNIERPLKFICPQVQSINPGIIDFVDNTNGFVQDKCYKGDLYKTTNLGESWEQIYSSEQDITQYHFANAQDGFLITNDILYTTQDAGITWNETQKLPNTFNYVLQGDSEFVFPEGTENIPYPDLVTDTNVVWKYDVNDQGDIAVVLYDETLSSNKWQLALYMNDASEWLLIDQLNDLEGSNSLYSSIKLTEEKAIYISASFTGIVTKYYLE